MFRLHLAVATALFILILSIVPIHGFHINNNINESDLQKDLPTPRDLVTYLKSLRRIIAFCSTHKDEFDMNFEFGLFLTNVHLKKVLFNPEILIPEVVRGYMILLLKQNKDMIEFFEYMVKKNNDPKQDTNKMITSLFSNETQWLKQLFEFESVLLQPKVSGQELRKMSSSWQEYLRRVDDVEHYIPHPQLSDKCMAYLAGNKLGDSAFTKCKIQSPCYDMLTNGTNFGYALSHRLLFLLHARHGRGCSVFSKNDDKALTKEFCTIAFSEAQYIAMNKYELVDLILEQMSLCALAGYTQFLQREWLSVILRYQTPDGCFGQSASLRRSESSILSRNTRTWRLAKHMDHRIMGGLCDGHITSVAAAALSAAIRFILETYVNLANYN